MARKPKKEQEEELDIKSEVKQETWVTRWFKEYAVNNATELKIICDLTSRSAKEQFFMSLKSGNTEVYAAVFYVTFLSILDFIRGKQKSYNNFTVEICNSINIGYVNNDNQDNEKIGNFMPIMEYIGCNRDIVDNDTSLDSDRTSQNFMRWKQLNVKKNVEYYKEIQELAYETLKRDYCTNLRTSEAVIPLFCIFMDHVTNVLKMKFKEAQGTDVSEVSINVLGLFDAYYSFNEEDNKEIIEFQPNITMKLALKADDVAMRDN